MRKKVSIQTAPRERKADHAHSEQLQDWVDEAGPDRIKRLTIDIPETLHRRTRVYCMTNNVSIAELVRGLLEKTV
jgi:hypothetical protein